MQDFQDKLTLLNQITELILGNEDLKTSTRMILDTLVSHIKAYGGGIYFIDEAGETLELFDYTHSTFIDRVVKVIPGNMFRFKFSLEDEAVLISKCVRENRVVESDHLKDFFYPIAPAFPLNTIQRLSRLRLNLGIPIQVNGKVIGVLFATFQKESLSEEDLSMLIFYAHLSGMAIDRSRKMNALNVQYEQEKEFTSLLGHELKTPIAMVYNKIQMLRHYLEENEALLGEALIPLKQHQLDIQNSIERMNRVCESILKLREVESRVDSQQTEGIDLELLLEQTLSSYVRRAQSKNLGFHYDLELPSTSAYHQSVHLEQIMIILLDNAFKYTPKGEITVRVEAKENAVVCTVTDTGHGIPKQKRERVFDRFYKNANKEEGLGLGLYLAKRMVDDLKGQIRILDNPSKRGTQFEVSLPL